MSHPYRRPDRPVKKRNHGKRKWKHRSGFSIVDTLVLLVLAMFASAIIIHALHFILVARSRIATTVACRNLLADIADFVRTPEDLSRSGWQAGTNLSFGRCLVEVLEVSPDHTDMTIRYRAYAVKKWTQTRYSLLIAR